MKRLRSALWLCLLALATACSSAPEKPPYPGIKLGKEYEIYGRWYKPHYEADYDEIGMASWYGPGFHGGKTASGEHFDQNDLTAAHRTLPLPSIVRVTNLDNGKSALVRINDRGPFARSRIIDLSKGAAVKLGVIRTGTAKVRVQFLERETRQFVQNMRRGTQYAMESLNHMDSAPPPQPEQPQPLLASAPIESAPLAPAPAPPIAQQPEETPPADIFSVVDNSPTMRPSYVSYEQASAPIGNGFFVQAGTFGVQANANALVDRLGGLGRATVTPVSTNGRQFYRVMIGPYDARLDAKNMLSKLASIGIPDAKIIHN